MSELTEVLTAIERGEARAAEELLLLPMSRTWVFARAWLYERVKSSPS